MKRRAGTPVGAPAPASGRPGKKPRKPKRGSSSDSKAVTSSGYELDLNQFPDKVRWLLDTEVAPDALWWLDGGDAIGINKAAFSEQLLVQEFRGNKFSSITRKLNRWGFRRIDDEERVPEDSIAYSHDFFIRDKVEMMRFMKKEEDRKPAAEELPEEETKASPSQGDQVTVGLGGNPLHELRLEPSQLAFSPAAGLMRTGSSLPFGASLGQQQLHPGLIASRSAGNPMLAGNNAASLPLATAAMPAEISNPLLTPPAAVDFSVQNRLAMSMQLQQRQLLEQRQQQQLILQQERRQRLRRLSAGAVLDPASLLLQQQQQQQQLQLDASRLLQQQSRQDRPVNPVLASATSATTQSQVGPDDALRSQLLTSSNLDNISAGLAAAPPVSSFLPMGGNVNPSLLLQQRQQQQHEQIEQQRLLQLQQQLSRQQQQQRQGAAASQQQHAALQQRQSLAVPPSWHTSGNTAEQQQQQQLPFLSGNPMSLLFNQSMARGRSEDRQEQKDEGKS